jgi:hypothetical protein
MAKEANVLNVIYVIDNIVQEITSYNIGEGDLVVEAEAQFSEIAYEMGANYEDIDSYIEDGYYSLYGVIQICQFEILINNFN